MNQGRRRASADAAAVYASTAEYRVMPLQNTLHGAVLETLDCLLSCLSSLDVPSRKGKERGRAQSPEELADDTPRLVASLDLHIQHCLVARRGTKMKDIRWVRSHEQVRLCSADHDWRTHAR